MKKIRGMGISFFMCWGMFLAIPCPVRVWKEEARGKMLLAFPLIGLVVGGLWAAFFLLADGLGWRKEAAALALAAVPWLATGFLHLDGYLDVCDAVLSRSDLEDRRRILKDPRCGAFGVAAMALLGMAALTAGTGQGFSAGELVAVPVAVRAAAAIAVFSLRPMGSSQYSGVERPSLGSFLWLGAMGLGACLIARYFGDGAAAPAAAILTYSGACLWAYRGLDGMSGDVSGFALALGELAGFFVAGSG